MEIYFRDILLVNNSKGANNYGQHVLEKKHFIIWFYEN